MGGDDGVAGVAGSSMAAPGNTTKHGKSKTRRKKRSRKGTG
jgi:hypothetical protein